jgi:FixJ family two-component response regulator
MPMAEEQGVVFVIDDDVSAREAVEGVARSIGLRAQAFASTQAFLGTSLPEVPCCIVLDVRLPGVSGLEFQRDLAQANIDVPIVFVTGYGDVAMTVRAMKAGAVEFLTKPFRDQDLVDAIQQALERHRASLLHNAELALLRRRFETLTGRERQVLALVVTGKLNKEIAAELGTSEITVKVHRGHMMHKLEAESVIDLVRIAEKLGVGASK